MKKIILIILGILLLPIIIANATVIIQGGNNTIIPEGETVGSFSSIKVWNYLIDIGLIYPFGTSTDVVVIGKNSTSSDDTILEVEGNSYFQGNATTSGSFASNEFCINTTTPDCIASWPTGGSSGNPFNQWLDTTSTPEFVGAYLTASTTVVGDFTAIGNTNLQGSATTTDRFYAENYISLATSTPWGHISIEGQGTNPAFVVSDTANNTDFIVDASGNVGIGTVAPSVKFEVTGDAYVHDGGLRGGSVGIGAYGPWGSNIREITTMGGALILQYTGTGSIGIGTTAPGATLHVSGTYDPLFISATSGKVAIFDTAFEGGYGFTVNTTTYFAENLVVNGSATSTFAGPITLADNKYITFTGTGLDTIGIGYSNAHGAILFGEPWQVDTVNEWTSTGHIAFASNAGVDAGGNWEPYFSLNVDGSVDLNNTTQGNAGDRVFNVGMTDGMIVTGSATSTATSTAQGLKVGNLISCDSIDTNAEGHFVCGADATGGGFAFPWTDTTYGMSTSTILGFTNGFMSMASSTVIGDFRVQGNLYATLSLIDNLTVSNLAITLNATSTNAFEVGACTGTNIDFTNDMCVLDDVEIEGDLYVTGNATIGADLTVNGQASTTLFADYSANKVGINTTTPWEALSLATGDRISLSTNDTNETGELIRLRAMNSTAKTVIAFQTATGTSKAWIAAHDMLGAADHKHLSFETADSAGALQTRLEIPYDCDNCQIAFTTDSDLQMNNGDIKIGIASAIEAYDDFPIYPENQATYGLSVTTSTADDAIGLQVFGASYLELKDDLHIQETSGLIWIDSTGGGDYASSIRLGGESGNTYQGGYFNYDAAANVFVIGTHNSADTTAGNDVEVIKIDRDGLEMVITASTTIEDDFRVNGSATSTELNVEFNSTDFAEFNVNDDGDLDIVASQAVSTTTIEANSFQICNVGCTHGFKYFFGASTNTQESF